MPAPVRVNVKIVSSSGKSFVRVVAVVLALFEIGLRYLKPVSLSGFQDLTGDKKS